MTLSNYLYGMKSNDFLLILPDKHIISMIEKIGEKREKRPYEKPLFQSEELFETAVLACGKLLGERGRCTPSPENT